MSQPSPGLPEHLVDAALSMLDRAHAPYSGFRVGAALLTPDGHVVGGCNVENASYGLSVCAERTAVVRAVAEGHRRFTALVVATETSPPVPPCGMCRQTLAEFADDLPILLVNPQGERVETRLSELLPHRFGPGDLDR